VRIFLLEVIITGLYCKICKILELVPGFQFPIEGFFCEVKGGSPLAVQSETFWSGSIEQVLSNGVHLIFRQYKLYPDIDCNLLYIINRLKYLL